MSTTLKKMMRVATALAMLLVLSIGSESHAQRDAGAKARGDIGSFWSQGSSQSSARRSFSYQGQVQTRRSFSYQPAPAARCPAAQESTAEPQAAEPQATEDKAAEAPQAVRRTYSYEPSVQRESRRAYSRRSAAPQRSTSPLLESKDARNNPR
jgi:hypothetical protein